MKLSSWWNNKKFWGAFFLAVSLWVYTGLNEQYSLMIDIPLIIEPPADRAIEELLPNKISVNAVGNGWYLFNYMYVNNVKKCKIKLSDVNYSNSQYTITSVDMRKGLEGMSKIRTTTFYPDQLVVKTGEIDSKEVNIVPNWKLNLKEGFILVDDIRLEPATVTISGNKKILDSIKRWSTASIVLDNIKSDFSRTIRLSDSLSSVLKVQPQTTSMHVKVQQYGEISFDDIEVKVVGGQLPPGHVLSPRYFKVILYGGIDLLSNIEAEDIKVFIEYNKIINDVNGILIPQITIPENTNLLSIQPKYIHHKVNVNTIINTLPILHCNSKLPLSKHIK